MKYIYVAKCGDYVKIGISKNPRDRIYGIGAGRLKPPSLAGPPRLIFATPGTFREEKSLHRSLERFRVTGEWYTVARLESCEVLRLLSGAINLGEKKPKRRSYNLTLYYSKADAPLIEFARRELILSGSSLSKFALDEIRRYMGAQ